MAWVVEITGWDGEAETAKRFCMGSGIAFEDVYAPGGFVRWSSASQRIDFSSKGQVEISGDSGELSIVNIPDDVAGSGPLDDIAEWVWQNRTASLYYVPVATWSTKILVARAVLEQPVVNLSASNTLTSALRFPLRDPRAVLETPLQSAKYAGDNVGPVGIEGDDSLKGRPKPVLYGLVSNLSPPRVNESLLIYQVADKAVTVLCVRDGGVSLGAGIVRANLASMQANDPVSGTYDILSTADGTFIRLGSTPIFGICVDADEASTEAAQSHAQIWSRLRTRIGSTVDAGSVTAADAVDDAGAGFYWDQEISQKDALAEVLASFSGYEVVNSSDVWRVAKLEIPSGTPKIEIVQLQLATRRKANTRLLGSISKARPKYAPDGAPPYRVTVNWGRNYTVMAPSDFAGAADPRLREKFSQEFRKVTATDTTIWNPADQTGPWKNAPEIEINTAYQPGDDGIEGTGAQAEADRLLELFTEMRGQYAVQYVAEVGDMIDPGDVVKVHYPRFGMSAGALFRVMEAGITVEGDVMEADMVLGLQA